MLLLCGGWVKTIAWFDPIYTSIVLTSSLLEKTSVLLFVSTRQFSSFPLHCFILWFGLCVFYFTFLIERNIQSRCARLFN